METIAETFLKLLTSETNFSNYLLIIDAYSNPPKLYRTEIITTDEVMGESYMFQARFRKVDEFDWWEW